MRRSVIAATSVLAVGLTLQAAPAMAAPATIVSTCGTTVSGRAVLAADLTCATGDGITLSDGAVLDLQKHTLTGAGAGTGIHYTAGGTATIKNGTVRNWDAGVGGGDFLSPSTLTVFRLVLEDNETALAGDGATVAVSESRVSENEFGITGSNMFATVTTTRFLDNTGVAASVVTGGRVAVASSVFNGNNWGASCNEGALTVSASTFTDNTLAVSGSNCGVDVAGSTFTGNATAYTTSFSPGIENEITSSKFISNTVAVSTKVSTVLTGNKFYKNRTAFKAVPPSPDAADVTFTLDGNTFDRNLDALYVTFGSTLKNNHAINNTRFGIYAPKATDLGGNTAYGNGSKPQCVGVACTP